MNRSSDSHAAMGYQVDVMYYNLWYSLYEEVPVHQADETASEPRAGGFDIDWRLGHCFA